MLYNCTILLGGVGFDLFSGGNELLLAGVSLDEGVGGLAQRVRGRRNHPRRRYKPFRPLT